MKSRSETAKNLFLEGYNCAQAVVGAFAGDIGVDLDTAMRLASPFGGGMGRMREVCGAVSGMFIVLGYYYGNDDPKDPARKTEIYERVQELANTFKRENGSIICRELLGLNKPAAGSGAAVATNPANAFDPTPEKRTETYYKKRPCPELVAYAAEILDEYIKTHQK